MVISKTMLKKLEHSYGSFPSELKQYLLVHYSEEPFPYEYSEQDLYENIRRDICAYKAGELDVKIKSPSERWQEEREYLQELYIEKCQEVHALTEYIVELEKILSEHGLESSRMAERRQELSSF